jgi:hypothetical protein
MKKLIRLLLISFIFLTLPVYSKSMDTLQETFAPIQCEITFDWISKTQMQRDENIAKIRDLLFSEETVLKYNKKEFKSKYAQFFKDKNSKQNYIEILNGKKEDENKYYCGFYWRKFLVAYGLQYKNNMKNIYYYDAMGNLRWVDVFSCEYPQFPYWSYQYDKLGKLVAAYYYLSDYDQYIFNPDKKFKGRWYKENMYNSKAKVIMTRSNY